VIEFYFPEPKKNKWITRFSELGLASLFPLSESNFDQEILLLALKFRNNITLFKILLFD